VKEEYEKIIIFYVLDDVLHFEMSLSSSSH